MATNGPPKRNVEQTLHDLLEWLSFWKDADEAQLENRKTRRGARTRKADSSSKIDTDSLRKHEIGQMLLSPDGPLGWLKFWEKRSDNTADTTEEPHGAGARPRNMELTKFVDRLSAIHRKWLRTWKSITDSTSDPPIPGPQPEPPSFDLTQFEQKLTNVSVFMVDSLCPWDYDRRDFGLTFTNSWTDADVPVEGAAPEESVVKVTSTIKPLHQEWKLTARTKLMSLGRGGILFGKAAVYLAGEQPAYVGLEADRVFDVPMLERTKAFANLNYRSSRKPHTDPVVASVGVQQTFPVSKGLELTLRVGVTTRNVGRTFFVSPVPNGSYF